MTKDKQTQYNPLVTNSSGCPDVLLQSFSFKSFEVGNAAF